MAEIGADPAYMMAQIGHKDSRFTLNVYTHVGNRRHTANEQLGSLLHSPIGHKWVLTVETTQMCCLLRRRKAASSRSFDHGRCRDRTSDLLLVRQALSQLS
jgi:hypothetical protein